MSESRGVMIQRARVLEQEARRLSHKLALHPDSKPSIGLVSEVEDLIEDTEALRAHMRPSDG